MEIPTGKSCPREEKLSPNKLAVNASVTASSSPNAEPGIKDKHAIRRTAVLTTKLLRLNSLPLAETVIAGRRDEGTIVEFSSVSISITPLKRGKSV